ncbi:YtoQ family protein [Aureibacillus halotolerans]|uniref:YtoQ family protein n=1 Tax=Aureibacillus halotolerans TaxID=1508390 RepID=A0A4R6TYP0_9BACI|nr:YtoQ family protein [Aureibacillus halotolerans]TDQ39070.1 YtoQ family protein [Aureibacillus halotolerans]
MTIQVYLAGQIHDPWQEEFYTVCRKKGVNINAFGPIEQHSMSDQIGEQIKGKQPDSISSDEAASSINNLRTKVLLAKADVVVAYFGSSYKQWNTASDCGVAFGLGKPVLLVRDPSLHHALKEVSNHAQVTVESFDQAAEVLHYITKPNDYTNE